MRYEKPELIIVESALVLVLGVPLGFEENGVMDERVPADFALGLDD